MVKHYPVMIDECIKALDIKPDGIYVDLTLGRGGHSAKILQKLTTGLLIAFDKDNQAIKESEPRLADISDNFKLIHADYHLLRNELEKLKIRRVDGILADLGVSSPQLDEAHRGFSYRKDARLDMRMDQEQTLDAYHIVNQWSEEQLVKIFRNYADVKLPKRVAKGIISNRPITTTLELDAVVKKELPAAVIRQKNPSKAIFQAIRIAVNDEINSLQIMLDEAIGLLKPGAHLAIITFHSLEDRNVKRKFGSLIKDNSGKLPIIIKKKYSAKTFWPSPQELEINRRSRSAKLRVLTKL